MEVCLQPHFLISKNVYTCEYLSKDLYKASVLYQASTCRQIVGIFVMLS